LIEGTRRRLPVPIVSGFLLKRFDGIAVYAHSIAALTAAGRAAALRRASFLEPVMKPHPFAVSFALAASLLASSPSFADSSSGIVRFTGMIVEPPCSFALDAAGTTPARVRPDCPRPAAGQIAFVDAASSRTLKTATFTQASHPIALPSRAANERAPMIAIVTYQ
jgi:hypothetical protein